MITEMPLVIVNVQRGGPSTGLPTKTEQSDLMQALYGRNGDAPMPVIAASTPGDCFEVAYEACRIAVKYMTPVLLLSDGYLANGSEPWLIPDPDSLNAFDVTFADKPNHKVDGEDVFWPYLRDEKTLARPWAKPGTAGLEHRVGGLEKEDGSGNVSYDSMNHEKMTQLRFEKVKRIQQEIPATEIFGDPDADLLIVGWGSTRGAIEAGVTRSIAAGLKVASIHLRFISPLPGDLTEVFSQFKQFLVPELNNGQLVRVLRDEYLLPFEAFNKVQGRPFGPSEIAEKVAELVG
jgi:2-oxoglutarate ferredoxin oxidoreductase subunit alpha